MNLISLKSDYAFRELFSYENVRRQFLSDVMGIPLKEIREVRITTPFLWKRRARQKQGILDMALKLNRDIKVNVEMQVRRMDEAGAVLSNEDVYGRSEGGAGL